MHEISTGRSRRDTEPSWHAMESREGVQDCNMVLPLLVHSAIFFDWWGCHGQLEGDQKDINTIVRSSDTAHSNSFLLMKTRILIDILTSSSLAVLSSLSKNVIGGRVSEILSNDTGCLCTVLHIAYYLCLLYVVVHDVIYIFIPNKTLFHTDWGLTRFKIPDQNSSVISWWDIKSALKKSCNLRRGVRMCGKGITYINIFKLSLLMCGQPCKSLNTGVSAGPAVSLRLQ